MWNHFKCLVLLLSKFFYHIYQCTLHGIHMHRFKLVAWWRSDSLARYQCQKHSSLTQGLNVLFYYPVEFFKMHVQILLLMFFLQWIAFCEGLPDCLYSLNFDSAEDTRVIFCCLSWNLYRKSHNLQYNSWLISTSDFDSSQNCTSTNYSRIVWEGHAIFCFSRFNKITTSKKMM